MGKLNGKEIYRKLLIAVVLITVLSSSACTADKNKDDSNYKDSISLSLDSQEDSQPYWDTLSGHDIAKAETGYYYIDFDTIRYFDPETEINIPLCAKPDCQHNDNSCNAVIGIGTGYFNDIYYYKGYLYMMKEVEGKLMLEQINQDGTGRRELFDVDMPTRYSGSCNMRLVFYKDCVYIHHNEGRLGRTEEGDVSIRCRSLDGKVDEIVYTYTGVSCFIECGKIYGGKLFFCVNEAKTDPETKQNSMVGRGLYAYDMNSKKTSLVVDEPICDYAIDVGGNILYYYVSYDGLYKMDLATGEAQLLLPAAEDTMIVRMSFDGKYLYLNNARWYYLSIVKCSHYMIVLDTQGNEINRIEVSQSYFGDENYVFAQEPDRSHKAYLPKQDIESAKEWIKFPEIPRQRKR